MAIEFCREPIEDRVERHGNDDAPDNDRQKWSDQNKRPVSQQSEANDSNDEKHQLFIRCPELQRSFIVVHCRSPPCLRMNFAVALCHVLFLRNQEGVGRCPSWLKLPVNALKIDKAFVQGLAHDTNGQKIVRIILDLARSLHLETVAEGVEDGKTLALLGEWGCDHAQGFVVHRPSPSDQLVAWIERNSVTPAA